MESRMAAMPKDGSGRFGLTGQQLKIIAIIAMVVDHAARAFVPQYYSPLGILLHFIGRITGPTMFFFVAEGCRHTRSMPKYAGRMFLFCAVSYLPFIWFKTGGLPHTAEDFLALNVFFTLGCGVLALGALRFVRSKLAAAVLVAGLITVSYFGDWGVTGVVMMVVFYLAGGGGLGGGSFRLQAAAYCGIVAVQVLTGVQWLWGPGGSFNPNAVGYMIVQCGMFVPIILLGLYNGRRGGGGKWLFYVFYPAHLVVICLIRMWLGAAPPV